LRKLNAEPFIGAFHQVSVHLAKQLQRRRFLFSDKDVYVCESRYSSRLRGFKKIKVRTNLG
jgi:hypothetical protein